MSFKEAWTPFKINDLRQFLDLSDGAVLAIMLLMFLLHITISSIILKIMLKRTKVANLVCSAFYTTLSPPLHFDWDFFHRLDGDGILKCWKRFVS